jgi:hypothetical protein
MQHEQAGAIMNNINPSDSGLGLVETGRFWENDGQSGIVRIVEF